MIVCGPSVNAGSVLSASVQVPSPLFVRWVVHTIDSYHNFRSWIIYCAVNAGVLSLVNAVVTATVGATASTTADQVMTVACWISRCCSHCLTISQVTWIWYCPFTIRACNNCCCTPTGKVTSLLNLFSRTCDRITCIDRINHWCIWCCGIYCHHRICCSPHYLQDRLQSQ